MFTPPPPNKKKRKRFFLDLDSLSICKKYTNTESSYKIVQIRKNWARYGGGVCGLGEWGGGLVVSEFFDKESNFFRGSIFL